MTKKMKIGLRVLARNTKLIDEYDHLEIEDSVQCLCTKANGCDALISNDGGFYDCGVDIITSEQFLQKFGETLEH